MVLSVLACVVLMAVVLSWSVRWGVIGSGGEVPGGFVPAVADTALAAEIERFERGIAVYDSTRRAAEKRELGSGVVVRERRVFDKSADVRREEVAGDSAVRRVVKRYFEFELNGADSALLTRLPGIGPVRAAWIVGYRERLGGYVSVGQLADEGVVPEVVVDSLRRYAMVDTAGLRRVRVNRCGIRQLRRHPYIDYYLAREIYDVRWSESCGGVMKREDMCRVRGWTEEVRERVLPYLDFE